MTTSVTSATRRLHSMSVERFPVEAGHVLTFARAIGDENPAYRDPDSAAASEAGGLIAPPPVTIPRAPRGPDYPLRPQPPGPGGGSGARGPRAPVAPGRGAVHAAQ